MPDINAKVIADKRYRNLSIKIMALQSLNIVLTSLAFCLLFILYGKSESLSLFVYKGFIISILIIGYNIYVLRSVRKINAERIEIYMKKTAEHGNN